MELKRCNSVSDVETFLRSLPADQEVIVDETKQYWYVYDEGEMLGDCINPIYDGPAGKFTL